MILKGQPSPSEQPPDLPREPARNQFGLRGMFLLMTAICLILGAVSWAGINQPRELLGALALVIFCAATIGVIEAFQRLTARRRAIRRVPQSDLPGSPFALENPFRDDAALITAEVIPDQDVFLANTAPDGEKTSDTV